MINIMNMISKRKLVAFAAIFICMLVHCNLVKAGTGKVVFCAPKATYSGDGTAYTMLSGPQPDDICKFEVNGSSVRFSPDNTQLVIYNGKITITPNTSNEITVTSVTFYGTMDNGYPYSNDTSIVFKSTTMEGVFAYFTCSWKDPLIFEIIQTRYPANIDYIAIEYTSPKISDVTVDDIEVTTTDEEYPTIKNGDKVTLKAGSSITVTCEGADYLIYNIGNGDQKIDGSSFTIDGTYDAATFTVSAYVGEKMVKSISFTLTIPAPSVETPIIPDVPQISTNGDKSEIWLKIGRDMELYYKVYILDETDTPAARRAEAVDPHAGYTKSDENDDHFIKVTQNADNTDTHALSSSKLVKTATNGSVTNLQNLGNRQLLIEAYAYNPQLEQKSDLIVYGVKSDGTATGMAGIELDDETETVWFDMTGRRVAEPQKGVYVRVKGSKVEKVAI